MQLKCLFPLRISEVRTLPGTDAQVPSEEHVEEPAVGRQSVTAEMTEMAPGQLVADVEAEALPHHHVPGRPEPLVQGLLDQLGSLNSRILT